MLLVTYDQKLRLGKILVSAGITIAALLPLIVDFNPSSSPHQNFHRSWSLFANLFAWPVLLFAIWSKLHGSGRSVRLAAFLGMTSIAGLFTAANLLTKTDPAFYDTSHVVFDINVFLTAGLAFCLLALGSFLSIRRGPKS